MTTNLYPAESIALTVARAQTERGEAVPRNTATMLVMALDRLTGGKDWTATECARCEGPVDTVAISLPDDLLHRVWCSESCYEADLEADQKRRYA